MDCNIIKNNIYSCKTLMENFTEEKVEFDIVIPDYCAPAVRILKCDVFPAVTSKSVDGDRLTIEGKCTVRVIYVDEDSGSIRTVSENTTFSQSQPLREQASAYRIRLRLRTSNVTCRLQNSRKISVKAVVGIAAKVTGNAPTEIIDRIEDCDIETMFENHMYCVYVNSGETDLRVSGEMELESDASEIIACDGSVIITDIKLINDKAVVKGDAHIQCLYTTGDSVSDLETVSGTIPFSEIVDIDGAAENGFCDVECVVNSIHCDIGSESRSNVINAEIEASLSASAYADTEHKFLRDVYSRNTDLNLGVSEISVESMSQKLQFSDTVSERINLDIENAYITEVCARSAIKNISARGNSLIIDGDAFITIYAHNGTEYKVIDRTVPYSVTKDINPTGENLRCEANVNVKHIDFTMTGGTEIDVVCELEFGILMFERHSGQTISSIERRYDNEERDFGSKVILYYADTGERLWDIAKKYYTSVEILKRDNQMEEDTLPSDRMLLISRI